MRSKQSATAEILINKSTKYVFELPAHIVQLIDIHFCVSNPANITKPTGLSFILDKGTDAK